MTGVIDVKRLALVASSTERAQEAAAELSAALDFVSIDEAETVIALGGETSNQYLIARRPTSS